jgi:hypothetical protein
MNFTTNLTRITKMWLVCTSNEYLLNYLNLLKGFFWKKYKHQLRGQIWLECSSFFVQLSTRTKFGRPCSTTWTIQNQDGCRKQLDIWLELPVPFSRHAKTRTFKVLSKSLIQKLTPLNKILALSQCNISNIQLIVPPYKLFRFSPEWNGWICH